MKLLSLAVLLALTSFSASAQRRIECERFQIIGGVKTNISIYRFEAMAGGLGISLQRVYGQPWLVPDSANLQAVWSGRDGQRVIATTSPNEIEKLQLMGPFFVLEVDFLRPWVRTESFGRFEPQDPRSDVAWNIKCRHV